MRCKERSGFLFAHTCDYAAATKCTSCGKDVCKNHLRPGNVCVSCEKRSGATTGQRPGRGSRHADDYDDPYWYAYGYYDDYHYYDDRDQRVFDPESAPSDADFEGDFDGS